MKIANEPAKGVELYIPHKPVVRRSSESTKLRIVNDASARVHQSVPSLNACTLRSLSKISSGINSYTNVCTQSQSQKAFLQIQIKESERDVLRFHRHSGGQSELETLRFTRAQFGLVSSAFLFGKVIECHLSTWEEKYPEVFNKIRQSAFIDDLLSGGQTIEQAQDRTEKAI